MLSFLINIRIFFIHVTPLYGEWGEWEFLLMLLNNVTEMLFLLETIWHHITVMNYASLIASLLLVWLCSKSVSMDIYDVHVMNIFQIVYVVVFPSWRRAILDTQNVRIQRFVFTFFLVWWRRWLWRYEWWKPRFLW